ncbi:hypothetical protein L1887_10780 [Cichorium endivia]|nr:hypothetical protein L1887_10780 [Cichorium endivia]
MSSSQKKYFVLVCTGGHWSTLDGQPKYVSPNHKNYGVKFSSNINFHDFSLLVKSKAGFDAHSSVRLSIQHPEYNYVMEIVDDNDILHLIEVIEAVNTIVCIYVVADDEIRSNNLCKTSHEKKSSGFGSNNAPRNIMTTVPETVIQEPIHYVEPENFNYAGEDDIGTCGDDQEDYDN